jgi:hypothetical protein
MKNININSLTALPNIGKTLADILNIIWIKDDSNKET